MDRNQVLTEDMLVLSTCTPLVAELNEAMEPYTGDLLMLPLNLDTPASPRSTTRNGVTVEVWAYQNTREFKFYSVDNSWYWVQFTWNRFSNAYLVERCYCTVEKGKELIRTFFSE